MTQDELVYKVRFPTGLELRYTTRGGYSGTTVLMLHPWAESLGTFDRLIPFLPSWMQVLAFDQRGHGLSDKPLSGYSLADLADDVIAFMDAMDLPEAVLLGSSSGGYVAQEVAVRYPQRVTGLVLVGAPRSLRDRPYFADQVERLTDPVDRSWVRVSLGWFPRFHDVPEWYFEDRVADGARTPAYVWRETLHGLMSAEPPTEAGNITAPTLLLWGERDDQGSRADQDRLAAAIPGSRLIVYPDTGYLVLWEQPARVAQDLTDFVEELGSAVADR